MNSNTNFIDFVSKTTDKLISKNDIATEFRLNNLSKLKKIGLPTHRKGNEEWKYTNLNKFTSINYILPVVETEDSNLKSQKLLMEAKQLEREKKLIYLQELQKFYRKK